MFSVAGGLILGFSKTFWFQSTSVEVYSLHLALISAALYTLIRAYVGVRAKKDSLASQLVEGGSSDFSGGNRINSGLFNVNSPIAGWLLFAFVLALAFSNHLTTILIIPATALLFFLRFGFKREGWITLVKCWRFFSCFDTYLPVSSNPRRDETTSKLGKPDRFRTLHATFSW